MEHNSQTVNAVSFHEGRTSMADSSQNKVPTVLTGENERRTSMADSSQNKGFVSTLARFAGLEQLATPISTDPSPAVPAPIVAGDVWTRGDKFAHGRAVVDPPPVASPLVPVKNHVRGMAEKKPLTREVLLHEFRLHESTPLRLGKLVYLWSHALPETDRAGALQRLKEDLLADDQVTAAGRVDRFVALYWVARLLGWQEAQKVRVGAIRELCRLIARNPANDEWQIRASCETGTRDLWGRMVKERLTAAVVRTEVLKIRPSRSVKMHGRSAALVKLVKEISRLKRENELDEVLRAVQERLAALHPSATAVA